MRINPYVPDASVFMNSKSNNINTVVGGDTDKVHGREASGSFFSTLQEKLNEVNDKQIEAEDTTQGFIKGDVTDVHQVMIASAEAKMSLDLAVQVRNKLVEAYQEINRMQI